MPADFILARAATLDLDAAYEWYECQKEGLGATFLDRVTARFREICEFPLIETTVHRSYRRAIVDQFPYGIYYSHDAGIVTVYAVVHLSRDRRFWRDRLP